MTEEQEAMAAKPADLKTVVTTAVIVKIAGIIGAAILLILQAVITGETASINKDADMLVTLDKQIAEEIQQIKDLIEKHK